MSILKISLFGDAILNKKAKQVKKIDSEIIKLVSDMFDTMKNGNGIGLAANQVGSDKSIFIVDISQLKNYESFKPIVFLNPKIVHRSKEKSVIEEGCLSVPTLRAEVERPKFITIVFKNLEGKEITLEADDLLARVIQHEYDHLQGIYFTDRILPDVQKKLKKSLVKIKNRKIEFEYPVTSKSS